MTIKFSPGAPDTTLDKLHPFASELKLPLVGVLSVGAAAAEPLKIGAGYRVHFVSAESIADGKLLDPSTPSRWRHLLIRGLHADAEVELDESQTPMALHHGPGKDGLSAALTVAAAVPGDFEAAVLSAPAIRFIALWLHGAEIDWIIPYAPDLTPLPKNVPVVASAALKVLQPLAKQVLEEFRGGEAIGG